MKATTVIACVFTILLLQTACEPVPHYNRIKVAALTGQATHTPAKQLGKNKPYGSVKLYQSKEEVGRKYQTVAIMSLEGDAGDEARFITAFLYRAADLGADGIIFYREGQSSQVKINTGLWTSVESKAHGVYRAEAISFE